MQPIFQDGCINTPEIHRVDQIAIVEACETRGRAMDTGFECSPGNEHGCRCSMIGSVAVVLRNTSPEFTESHDQNPIKISLGF